MLNIHNIYFIRFYHNFNLMYSKIVINSHINLEPMTTIKFIQYLKLNFYNSLFSFFSSFSLSKAFGFASLSFIRATFIFFVPSNNPPS